MHPNKESFKNLAEMVHAFLILWGEEIQLKDLQNAALRLGLTKASKSISRVLKSYDDKFYSCEKYPECGFSSWDLPLSEKCPDCGEPLFYRKSKNLVLCRNKDCGYKREEELQVDPE